MWKRAGVDPSGTKTKRPTFITREYEWRMRNMFAFAAAPSISKGWNASNAKAISTAASGLLHREGKRPFFGAHSIEMCTFFIEQFLQMET